MSGMIEQLGFLIGTWKGGGRAEYPTIDPTDYREETVFASNGKDPVLHYEQRTWVESAGETKGQPLFWESGFFVEKEGGIIELVTAQKSGRMELLRGRRSDKDTGIALSLESVNIVNDDRLIRSGRYYTLTKDRLEYRLKMAMTKHPDYDIHLTAVLSKVAR